MLGIRTKLLLGFGCLFVIVAVLGLITIGQIRNIGQSIDIILRENYCSVNACQEMKEALERLDCGLLFYFLGDVERGRGQIEDNLKKFYIAVNAELNNITLPGEKRKAEKVRELFRKYHGAIPLITDLSRPYEVRRATYFSTMLPCFQKLNSLAQEIIQMNQDNMLQANEAARHRAALAYKQMLAAIMACAAAAVAVGLLSRRWILMPIRALTESADEIRRGNLDLVLEVKSRDEIGRLSEAFNAMAEGLRRARTNERRELILNRQASKEVVKSLPDAVAVFDLDGNVEVSSETAERYFGLKPGVAVKSIGLQWLSSLVSRALLEGRPVEHYGKDKFIQHFVENREHFFQPLAVPIPSSPVQGELTGCSVIIKDVSHDYEHTERKRGVLSTISHQLKTPLTSLRMSMHLLLDDKIGNLNEKQTELLIAARDDSERLSGILDDLLDISRIESGKDSLEFHKEFPCVLARISLEPFLIEAKDRGITLDFAVPEDLPKVMADPTRICHVFSNLLSNALRFTNPGGMVSIEAEALPGFVKFLIKDTGKGIPRMYQNRIFEQFFRIPGQEDVSGAGLGLAIVKEIVAAHDGTVGVESEVGKGSVFWFTLPCASDMQSDGTANPDKGRL